MYFLIVIGRALAVADGCSWHSQHNTYDALNKYISSSTVQEDLADDAFESLIKVLYISSKPALTVMVRCACLS